MQRSPLTHSLVAAVALLAPTGARAQQPWTATFTATVNPLAIGGCGPVRLTLLDPATKAWPRNPSGNYVALSDFDLSVTGVDPTGVAGEYNGPSIWSACACQGATVGSVATVTATYPAALLAPKQRVPGIAIQASSTFVIAQPRASTDVQACQTLKGQTVAAGSSASAGTSLVVPSPRSAPVPGSVTPAPPLVPGGGASLPAQPAGTSPAPLGVRPKALPAAGSVPAMSGPSGAGSGVAVGGVQSRQTVQPSSGQPAALVVNGTTMRADFVEGGSAVAVVSSANGSVSPTGAVRYEPIVVDVDPGGPMDALINSAWSGTPTQLSGSVRPTTGPTTTGSTLPVVFTNAQITSTTIPTLLGSATSGMATTGLRVTITPGSATAGPPATLTLPPANKFSTRNFLFDIPGIQSTTVTRIESFVVGGQAASSSQLGVPQLLVTLQLSSAADWNAWLNSSVASGWAASSEKTFTLQLMSSTSSHLATIQGDGVGIVALRNVTANSGGIVTKVEAELYVRHIHLLP
jgi:hypothetical protein